MLIFGWHNVEDSPFFPCAPGQGWRGLRKQLVFLARVTHIVRLSTALDTLSRGYRLPSRSAAITFDDGYRDTLDLAVPLLSELGLPATFFLVPGILSREAPAWWERLAAVISGTTRRSLSWGGRLFHLNTAGQRRAALEEMAEDLKRKNREERERALAAIAAELGGNDYPDELFMDWDDVRDLVRRGFDIGSHTMSHSILSRESREEQERDLLESRRQLEERTGAGVTVLAYPNGTADDYSEITIAATNAAGYGHALTTRPGWNGRRTHRYEIRRQMLDRTQGVPEIVSSVRRAARSSLSER